VDLVFAGEGGSGQAAPVKRRQQFSASGRVRCAGRAKCDSKFSPPPFTTRRPRSTGGHKITAYLTSVRTSRCRSMLAGALAKLEQHLMCCDFVTTARSVTNIIACGCKRHRCVVGVKTRLPTVAIHDLFSPVAPEWDELVERCPDLFFDLILWELPGILMVCERSMWVVLLYPNGIPSNRPGLASPRAYPGTRVLFSPNPNGNVCPNQLLLTPALSSSDEEREFFWNVHPGLRLRCSLTPGYSYSAPLRLPVNQAELSVYPS
jgi:hypothetical protein